MSTVAVTNDFTNGTAADAEEVDENFNDLVSYINTNCIVKDGSVAFTAVPSGPATDPDSANKLARKAYVDAGDATNAAAIAAAVATVEVRLSKSGTLAVGRNAISSWTEVADTSGFYAAADDEVIIPAGKAGWYGISLELNGAGTNLENLVYAIEGTRGGEAWYIAYEQTAPFATLTYVHSAVAYLDEGDKVLVRAGTGSGGFDTAKTQVLKFGLVKLG